MRFFSNKKCRESSNSQGGRGAWNSTFENWFKCQHEGPSVWSVSTAEDNWASHPHSSKSLYACRQDACPTIHEQLNFEGAGAVSYIVHRTWVEGAFGTRRKASTRALVSSQPMTQPLAAWKKHQFLLPPIAAGANIGFPPPHIGTDAINPAKPLR